MIEWFRVRGPRRTDDIPRGAGHRYPPRAFGRTEPWERELIETYEPCFAEIRALLHQIAMLRRQARHLTDAVGRWESGRQWGIADTSEPSSPMRLGQSP